MKISRTLALGALAFTVALVGCSPVGETPASPPATAPADNGNATEGATTPSEAPSDGGEEAAEEDLPLDDALEGFGSFGPDSDFDHPLCNVFAEYEQDLEGIGVLSDAQMERMKQLQRDAITAAPEDLKDQVEYYFDVLIDLSEQSRAAGEEIELQDAEGFPAFQDVLEDIIDFTFDECFDMERPG